MNKAILRSLPPKQCVRIANGEQTIVLSKIKPKLETPYKEYLYCTKQKSSNVLLVSADGKQVVIGDWRNACTCDLDSSPDWNIGETKVIGEYIVETIDTYKYSTIDGLDICDDEMLEARVEWEEVNLLAKGKTLYGLHISQVKIYDNPKELGEFKTVTRCKDWQCFEMCSDVCGIAENNQCDYGMVTKRVTYPPQSWCYVQPLE